MASRPPPDLAQFLARLTRARVLMATAILLHAAPAEINGQTIIGQVVDEASGIPIDGAAVTLLDSTGIERQSALTDADGEFRLTVRPGLYSFTVRRLGYAPFTSEVFRLERDVGDVSVTIAVTVEELVLDPVTVEGEAPPFAPGPLDDFERRRARGMGGLFVTYDDVQMKNASRVTDIFYGLAGVRVVRSGHNRFVVRMRGQAPRLQRLGAGRSSSSADPEEDSKEMGDCVPVLYVDGIRVMQPDETLNTLPTSEIYSAEVYRRASETPAEFLDSDSRCGVIVIWTKRFQPKSQ